MTDAAILGTLAVMDRCIEEGRAAFHAGLTTASCPYAYHADPDVEFERIAWLEGYETGFR